MKKINWVEKLSSRKFWLAIIGFITSILFAFNVAEVEIEKITGIITAGSVLVIYILTEGYVDSKRGQGNIIESGTIELGTIELTQETFVDKDNN